MSYILLAIAAVTIFIVALREVRGQNKTVTYHSLLAKLALAALLIFSLMQGLYPDLLNKVNHKFRKNKPRLKRRGFCCYYANTP